MNINKKNKCLFPICSPLTKGNDAFSKGKYSEAIVHYQKALDTANFSLKKIINANIVRARSKRDCEGAINELFKNVNEDGLLSNVNSSLTVPSRFIQTDCKLKIAVVLHIVHLDCLSLLSKKIANIAVKYDLFITTSRENKRKVEELLLLSGCAGKIIEISDNSYGVFSFISYLPMLIEGGYDVVCKLHTPKKTINCENYCADNGAISLNLLLNPILGSSEAVRQILAVFCLYEEVGMVGSADCFQSARASMNGNEIIVSQLLLSLSPQRDPVKDWGFFAESIFWARISIFKPLLALLSYFQSVDHRRNNDEELYPIWQGAEQIFGLLPEINNKTVVISYSLDHAGEKIQLTKSHHSNISTGNKYNIKTHVEGFKRINENHHFLKTHRSFSCSYYFKHCKTLIDDDFNPFYHYLRYGVYECCNPNSEFSSAYYWEEYPDVLNAHCNPFVHYLQRGVKEGRAVFPAEENIELISKIIFEASIFDEDYFLSENSNINCRDISPIQYYVQHGLEDRLQPVSSHIFDALWYFDEYLSRWRFSINPLLHYVICRSKRRLRARPSIPLLEKSDKKSCLTINFKRICLFAGYDQHGIIDDYVIDFISELKKYADVYYLSDGNLQPGELEKLKKLTKGAWAFRHGEYDFGSYSRLARDLVGWQNIRNYDELLLVNDSCYLINSLDAVFSKMERTNCDWWGLQATKGISATKNVSSNQFSTKVPMDTVLESLYSDFENDECYDFLIGSYFIAFRQQVFQKGGEFQKLLDGVGKEQNKKNIIIHYEIGLTRRLLLAGFRPATFIDFLYPFHPIYSRYHFDLLREGFPLFKRFLLTENHYRVPELWRWKQWVKKILPSVNLGVAEANLYRIADADKLYNTLHIPESGEQWPPPLLNDEQFAIEDRKSTISDFCWAFPVCGYDHQLGSNERMVFEYVKENPKIRKIILTRSKSIHLKGSNVEILPLKSLAGQRALMTARYIFIKHTPLRNAVYPLDTKRHRFINLWHGIPFKRIGYASLDMQDKLEALAKQHAQCHAVIASSPVDRLAMTAAFYPLNFNNIWVTGLPRNDLIMCEERFLPHDFRIQLNRLKRILQGRRLVLFAPTFRKEQIDGYYSFNDLESKALSDCLLANNFVLGIREHMVDKVHSYSNQLIRPNRPFINLNRLYFPDIEMLYRKASLLITDYSSCFFDFMLTGKPEICFAYDFEVYSKHERGFFYNLEDVFPGPVCHDFDDLLGVLQKNISGRYVVDESFYQFKRKLFFSYIDKNNTKRLIKKIAEEIECPFLYNKKNL